jgi:hypothetical protein
MCGFVYKAGPEGLLFKKSNEIPFIKKKLLLWKLWVFFGLFLEFEMMVTPDFSA